MADKRRIVVVGGGLAGAKTVEALRERGFDGPLLVVSAEDRLPYERPPLSKDYLQTGEGLDDATVHPVEWYDEQHVELRRGERATALDVQARTVRTDAGDDLPYDTLVLATGATPRRLDLPGADFDGVLSLRTVEDSDRLRAAFADGARVVIIGGGWIGLETAAAARKAGADVTVLESLEQPLLRVLGPKMGAMFADLHRSQGVDLRTGVTVEAIEGEGSVSGVRLGSGETLPTDVVVVGIGAAPSVELASDAGLKINDGVVVDASGRTSDEHVYAVGDVARYPDALSGKEIRVEHWANALNHPASVAAAILGEDASYDDLPYFFSDQYDLGMEYVGLADPSDEVVVRGDLDGRELIAFWVRDGRVQAGMNVNVWDVVDDVKALIRSKQQVDLDRLEDPDVPLTDLID
ncbi:NAD(P)/FAD-dependent oxidoreductase [Luteipulveratus halotolerans]|uniref:Pyridine nucleotide-disulfide oxidoreductase n=1 Tax=Luteipulveratus halotolerans TaxID=1631356 RepID=A0A0L6CJ82_9MICO|nr:FAD-dependent oxidoreductase [Luteipulveratus halotolerans]KNX37558.1 pyridine nucleotide-disulfide oxidoreductase [Luteipulveratus halotolerans]